MSEVTELNLQTGSFDLRKYAEEDDYLYETDFIILPHMFNYFDILDDFLYDCNFDTNIQLYNILHHKKGFTRCIRKIKEIGLYELWKTYLEQAAVQYALGYGIKQQCKMVTQKYKNYQNILFNTTYESI